MGVSSYPNLYSPLFPETRKCEAALLCTVFAAKEVNLNGTLLFKRITTIVIN